MRTIEEIKSRIKYIENQIREAETFNSYVKKKSVSDKDLKGYNTDTQIIKMQSKIKALKWVLTSNKN